MQKASKKHLHVSTLASRPQLTVTVGSHVWREGRGLKRYIRLGAAQWLDQGKRTVRHESIEAEGTALADELLDEVEGESELLDEVEGEGVEEADSQTASHCCQTERSIRWLVRWFALEAGLKWGSLISKWKLQSQLVYGYHHWVVNSFSVEGQSPPVDSLTLWSHHPQRSQQWKCPPLSPLLTEDSLQINVYDYSSANVQQQLQTENSGSPVSLMHHHLTKCSNYHNYHINCRC